jgi:glycosyltransferase involved in cell wall biosynthesis
VKLVFAIKRLENEAGGAERVLCLVCSALAKRGHAVTVVSFDRPGSSSFYSLDERVRWIQLAIGDTKRNARLAETLQRMLALRSRVVDIRPDAVVAFMHSMFVPAAFALAGTSIPVVGSEHIVPEHYRSRPLQWALLNLAAPLLAGMTVLSEAVRAQYPSRVGRRMTVMPNPVVGMPRSVAVEADEGDRVILNVGRLDPQKDQATLVQAFALLASDFPEWRLRIVGEGALRLELERLVERLGLAQRTSLPGVIREIDAEYQRAAIFAMPSRYESFGLATAEAMAHGLPVVGFDDCPGTNELVTDGETGILVRGNGDRNEAMAGGLRELMFNRERRLAYGGAGRTRARRMFDLDSVCDRWEQMLCHIRA